jgi:hypothetical protein
MARRRSDCGPAGGVAVPWSSLRSCWWLCCRRRGWPCISRGPGSGPTYAAAGVGRCNVSVLRAAADDLVGQLVRPSANGRRDRLAHGTGRRRGSELAVLWARRDAVAGLVADGGLTGAEARDRLATVGRRITVLERDRGPATSDGAADVAVEAWNRWGLGRRREVLAVLVDRLTVRHGHATGPRSDPTQLSVEWRSA